LDDSSSGCACTAIRVSGVLIQPACHDATAADDECRCLTNHGGLSVVVHRGLPFSMVGQPSGGNDIVEARARAGAVVHDARDVLIVIPAFNEDLSLSATFS